MNEVADVSIRLGGAWSHPANWSPNIAYPASTSDTATINLAPGTGYGVILDVGVSRCVYAEQSGRNVSGTSPNEFFGPQKAHERMVH